MSVLSVTALNQFYGGSHTLWDVSLDVPAGSRTCLMGRNGMGKTTLLKCIMGLLPAASGEIVFDGRRPSRGASRGTGAPRHRLRAARPRDFSAADR
jgi:urea transport system ATP-binding protein